MSFKRKHDGLIDKKEVTSNDGSNDRHDELMKIRGAVAR